MYFHTFRTTRLATFPDYLFIQLKKFTLGSDWVPKKLGNNSFIKNSYNISTISVVQNYLLNE